MREYKIAYESLVNKEKMRFKGQTPQTDKAILQLQKELRSKVEKMIPKNYNVSSVELYWNKQTLIGRVRIVDPEDGHDWEKSAIVAIPERENFDINSIKDNFEYKILKDLKKIKK